MNYGDAIVKFLRKQGPLEAGKMQVARTSVSDLRFSCEVVDFDKFSFILTRVEVTRASSPSDISDEEVRERAKKVRARLSYLGEELEFSEFDTENHRAQLRSAVRTEEGGPLYYYELLLAGREAVSLARYNAGKAGSGRTPKSFQVTAETLGRLVDDLAETIA